MHLIYNCLMINTVFKSTFTKNYCIRNKMPCFGQNLIYMRDLGAFPQNMVTDSNKETDIIRKIAGGFARHPAQVNQLMEADAEIIQYHGQYLVLKTDGIHEELKTKLYEAPYLIGWMAVTAPVSDIAAVGAVPEGILLSLQLPVDQHEDWLKRFQEGIDDACKCYHIYVLGGDTNFSDSVSISATVVAHIKSGKPLLRTGIKQGDFLYASSLLGTGNAFAYSRFFNKSLEIKFHPQARLKESKIIRSFASSCIDTSDGLFPALAVLSEVNKVGFHLQTPLEKLLSAEAGLVHRQAELPGWMLLAGPHGEYELLFTIPADKRLDFEAECASQQWNPVYLGAVSPAPLIDFNCNEMKIRCRPAAIANLFYESKGDILTYMQLLMRQHQNWFAGV